LKKSLGRFFARFSNNAKVIKFRFAKTKGNFQAAEKELDRVANAARRRALANQIGWGRNELRRLEWSVREAASNCFSSIREFERRRANRRAVQTATKEASIEKYPSAAEKSIAPPTVAARQKAIDSARKRAFFEREKAQRKILINILDNAEAIATIEPTSSLPDALRPIANELRAHYNEIKKRSRNQNITPKTNTLTDYWVSWAAVSSLLDGTAMDARIVKYASKDMKNRILRVSRFASPSPVTSEPNSKWLGFERPTS
jgi:hypothetical protein